MSLRRLSGVLLIIFAGTGIFLCILGLVFGWIYEPKLTTTIVDNLTLIDQSLTSTEVVLTTVEKMVQITSLDVASLQTTTKALSIGIHDANPMFDSLIQLTGKDLPEAIGTTQASLDSAQSSALIIDNTLSAVTRLPYFPLPPYKPAVPLHTALENVSTSLNTIKPSLLKINTSLSGGKSDLQIVDSELTKIIESTQKIAGSLGDAETVINNYKRSISQLRVNMHGMESAIPRWILICAWMLTFLLIWLILGQVGLALHGYEILKTAKKGKNLQERVN
jgi:hypothetical protein